MDLMTTREVADYLRLKERKIYEMVAEQSIPCCRVTGKWLFPKALIDLWLLQNSDTPQQAKQVLAPSRQIVGSHDPLLEWAARESRCELALLCDGSLDGLRRLAERQALLCGLHVWEAEREDYNLGLVERTLAQQPIVVLHWAWREQGLIVATDNPLQIKSISDLVRPGVRVIERQPEAGSYLLWQRLLQQAGLEPGRLQLSESAARTENEVALAVMEGRVDAGLGIRAAANVLRLGFVPLWRERFDLVLYRRDYFDKPLQTLLQFTRHPRFAERAASLGGYDISQLGQVLYNASC